MLVAVVIRQPANYQSLFHKWPHVNKNCSKDKANHTQAKQDKRKQGHGIIEGFIHSRFIAFPKEDKKGNDHEQKPRQRKDLCPLQCLRLEASNDQCNAGDGGNGI